MDSQLEVTNDQRMYSLSPNQDIMDPSGTHITADNIRAHFDQVRNQYNVSNDLPHKKKKTSRYIGGKLLYRSIEKPINVYSRPMDVIDVTDPEYKRDLKKLKKL